MIFQYSQNQRQGTYYENPEDDAHPDKRLAWDSLPREKRKHKRNSLESHNFHIQLSELNQGFPMKVIFETQKIDFNDHESNPIPPTLLELKMWENEAMVVSPQDSQGRCNLIPTEININDHINQISEREDEDEEAEDDDHEANTQTKYHRND